jgi:hypothetical protein
MVMETKTFRITLHAAARYAQRVLQLADVDERALRRDRALLGRCRRGVARVAAEAVAVAPPDGAGCVFLAARCRVLVVRGSRVLTVVLRRRSYAGPAHPALEVA